MNDRAEFDGAGDPFGRVQRREFKGICAAHDISAQQDSGAVAIEVSVGIGDLWDRQVGVADPAVDRLVLLPEPPLELQSDLHSRSVGNGVDCRLHAAAYTDRNLAKYGERNGADAPSRFGHARGRWRFRVLVSNRDAAIVLLAPGYPGIKLDQRATLFGNRAATPIHAADRLEHRGLEFM